jgi:hypothetical protein
MQVHAHSRFAKYLLSTMAVGKLRKEDAKEGSRLLLLENSAPSSTVPTIRRGDAQIHGANNTEDQLDKSPASISPAQTGILIKSPLNNERFRNYLIGSRKVISHPEADRAVMLMQILFDREDDVLTVQPGESVQFQFVEDDGRVVTRCYTPLHIENRGYIEFAVKMYGGQMTTYLKTGRSIRVRGPILTVDMYCPNSDKGCWKALGMIAGGTGKVIYIKYK